MDTPEDFANRVEQDVPWDCEPKEIACAIRDEAIAQLAAARLKSNRVVPVTVDLWVADGFLTLHGTVQGKCQKQEAEIAVRPLLGLKGLVNKIVLEESSFR